MLMKVMLLILQNNVNGEISKGEIIKAIRTLKNMRRLVWMVLQMNVFKLLGRVLCLCIINCLIKFFIHFFAGIMAEWLFCTYL